MPKVPRRPSPELLESLHPQVRTIPAGSVIWRVYFRGGLHPTNWKDFRHVGPIDARFDHHEENESTRQDRAVMHGADHPTTCLADVFQKTRVVNRWHNDPWLVGFETGNPVRLPDLTGTFPTRAGASIGTDDGPPVGIPGVGTGIPRFLAGDSRVLLSILDARESSGDGSHRTRGGSGCDARPSAPAPRTCENWDMTRPAPGELAPG